MSLTMQIKTHFQNIFFLMLMNVKHTAFVETDKWAKTRDVHYGTFRVSGMFQNLYFESRISNRISE